MRSRIRSARIAAVGAFLTIAASVGPVLHRGSAPAWAQTASSQAGECDSADTQKTTICHVPPGRPEQAQTSCVADSAVQPHLANHPADCVGGCSCRPPATYSTCAPVSVTQLHGEGFLGNTRLALVENGKVPCVHVETGDRRMCQFNAGSGAWVEAAEGNYARMGQAITPQGEPGGEWVVAARVSVQGTVPCVAPSGRDSAGIATGEELGIGCVIETLGSASNATGLPLLNYATLEVCTSSNPHPDNATLTRTILPGDDPAEDHEHVDDDNAPGIYCYIGQGAALNDPNGAERDANGAYYTSWQRCHVANFGDWETFVAKRPSTYFGEVQTNTPITWKPVAEGVAIANPQ